LERCREVWELEQLERCREVWELEELERRRGAWERRDWDDSKDAEEMLAQDRGFRATVIDGGGSCGGLYRQHSLLLGITRRRSRDW